MTYEGQLNLQLNANFSEIITFMVRFVYVTCLKQ